VEKEDIEIDEGYFGDRRKKQGHGVAGKVVVFGVLKRHGADTCRSHSALDVSEFCHHRISNSKVFSDKKNHFNGLNTFGTRRNED